jgi:hypothetical protein
MLRLRMVPPSSPLCRFLACLRHANGFAVLLLLRRLTRLGSPSLVSIASRFRRRAANQFRRALVHYKEFTGLEIERPQFQPLKDRQDSLDRSMTPQLASERAAIRILSMIAERYRRAMIESCQECLPVFLLPPRALNRTVKTIQLGENAASTPCVA